MSVWSGCGGGIGGTYKCLKSKDFTAALITPGRDQKVAPDGYTCTLVCCNEARGFSAAAYLPAWLVISHYSLHR